MIPFLQIQHTRKVLNVNAFISNKLVKWMRMKFPEIILLNYFLADSI